MNKEIGIKKERESGVSEALASTLNSGRCVRVSSSEEQRKVVGGGSTLRVGMYSIHHVAAAHVAHSSHSVYLRGQGGSGLVGEG